MVREVKFKAQRCFEGQWEGLLMMGGCGDVSLDRTEPEVSGHLQFPDMKEKCAAAQAGCPVPFP